MWSEAYTESILGNGGKAGHRAQSAPTIRGPRGCRKPVLLQKDLFLVIWMHICVCHVSVGINRDQKRASYPQKL